MKKETPAQAGYARQGAIDQIPSRPGIRRFSALELLVMLVLWIASFSFFGQAEYYGLIESVLTTLVMISAVLAVSTSRRTLVGAVLLMIPALVSKWLDHARPGMLPSEVHILAALAYMVFLVAHFLRFILRAPRVTSEVLCTAISAYLLLGILWSLMYVLVAELVPGSFHFAAGAPPERTMKGFEAVYFSFVTLCTVGYGDVVPVSRGAQMLAIAEAATGMFYVTILIARLVAIYSSERPSVKGGDEIAP
jgi:voltage-gated potassium channel